MKQQQPEGDGAHQDNCQRRKGRVQQTPEERKSDRDLGAPSPATVPTIPYRVRDTGGEIGRGAQGEDGRAKDPATKDALRTAKQTVGLRGTRGEEERENVIREKSDH